MRIHVLRSLAVVAWLAGATAAFGQTTAQSQGANAQEGLGVQIVGGPLFATLADAKDIDVTNKTGYLVGLGLGGNRGGRVGVEADILYGQKGAKVQGHDFDQHIIHVPMMLKVNIGSPSANGLSVFGLGGGFFDWQFNSKLAGVDISEDTDGYEVGFVAGAGFEVFRFSLQARYIRGVRQIDKTFDLGSSQEVKTQAFAILVALRLN